MYKIVIVVQNLKIGGFQRVALDEAYAFRYLGLDVCILTLEPFTKNEFYGYSQRLLFYYLRPYLLVFLYLHQPSTVN